MSRSDLRAQLAAIERDLDGETYRAGAWHRFLRKALRHPRADRIALVADVDRVSEKLHRRHRSGTVPFPTAMALELGAAVAGGALLLLSVRTDSNVAALAALVLLIATLQPLLKIAVGLALGIRYRYAYLLGVEPRFKMRYGTYVAAPYPSRIVFHVAGCVGSPFGAWLVARFARRLAIASAAAWLGFWVVGGLNLLLFLTALAGVRRLGRLPLRSSSGGAAAVELRDRMATRQRHDDLVGR